MRVFVTGADGQLGYELCRQLGAGAIALPKRELDISYSEAVHRVLKELGPNAVINAAAYTDVDGAETDARRCRSVNLNGARHVAEVCHAIGARLIQISTDYVYCGTADRRQPFRPFREEEIPCPAGVYAQSKCDAENAVLQYPQNLVVRTCGLYANRPEESVRNFAKTVLQRARQGNTLRVVDDQHCTPSYVPHVARSVLFLLAGGQAGIYHVVNSGATTWYRFAAELCHQARISARIDPIQTRDYPTAAARPAFSVLDTSKYASLHGPELPTWQQAVAEFLKDSLFES